MNKNSLTVAVCMAFVCCMFGCETTDYEPLRVKRKLKELEQGVRQLQEENQGLRREIEQLKGGDVSSATPPTFRSAETSITQSMVIDEPSRFSKKPSRTPLLSLSQEQALSLKLESKYVFFLTDDSGHTVEADLTECQPADVNSVVEQIRGFAKLKRITFAGNNTDSDTFSMLADIPTLERLDLPNSAPSTESMAKLATLPKLTFLELRKSTLDADSIEAIAGSKSLKQIRCAQTRMGDAELSRLTALKTLEAIDLSDCNRVSSKGVEYLSQCPRLKFLKLFGKAINDGALDIVGGMKSLRVLGLNDAAITDAGIAKLADLKLTEVHLFRTSIGDEAVAVFAKMPGLTTINLRDTRVSDTALVTLSECPKLRRIDLSECNSPGITDRACESLATMPSLEDINLWKTKVTDLGVSKLAVLPKLKKLNLDDTQVGDEAVTAIGKMKNLNWLHLGKTKITDASTDTLTKMTKLGFLDITFTNELSEDAGYDIADALEPLGCYVKM